MRKILKATTLGLILCMGVHAQEKPTFTWLDFTKENMNQTYTSSRGEQVRVKTNQDNLNPKADFRYTKDLDNPLIAVEEEAPEQKLYNRITLVGSTHETDMDKCPYILLDLGNTKATKIQVLGSALGGSTAELQIGFSSSSIDEDHFINDEDPLAFKANEFDIQELDVPANTKYIMLIAKADFANWNISLTSATDIHAIRLFTDMNTVSIDEQANEQLGLKINDRIISCLVPATIDVYSIAGIKVRSEQHIREINLSDLNAGAYIVKAKSPQTGKEELLKVLVR